MAIFEKVAKDAGSTAVHEAHEAVDGALATVVSQIIPAITQAVERIGADAETRFRNTVADVAARLDGAALPIDVTIHISGQIGPLHLSEPQKVEVKA